MGNIAMGYLLVSFVALLITVINVAIFMAINDLFSYVTSKLKFNSQDDYQTRG